MAGIDPTAMIEFGEDKMKRTSKALLMGVVFLGLSLGQAAGVGTGVVSVSPAAFQPKNYQIDTLKWHAYGNEFYFENGPDEEVWAYAPVSLPNWANVTGFTAVVTDNGSGVDDEIRVALVRCNILTGEFQTVAYVYTTAASASSARQTLSATSISNAIVDNATYAYYVGVQFYMPRSYIKFHGAKITYWSVM